MANRINEFLGPIYELEGSFLIGEPKYPSCLEKEGCKMNCPCYDDCWSFWFSAKKIKEKGKLINFEKFQEKIFKN